MIDLNSQNEWQYRDEGLGGLVMPWYTKPALDEIVTWELKGKYLFEFGGGASTLWFAAKGCHCFGIDTNMDYVNAVGRALIAGKWNGIFYFCEQKELYLQHIKNRDRLFDIVIIDGDPIEWRDECVGAALECLKPGGALIVDNWMQPSVWVPSHETQSILLSLPHKIYKQSNHPDWQTLIAWKPGAPPFDPLHELNRHVGNYE